jgi:3-hydroxyisobutyrate dehydrogenase
MRVGVIGLGSMGVPMAARLAAAGHDVAGFDIRPAARAALRARGTSASVMTELAELGAHADVAITILPSSREVLAVLLGEGGLADRLRAGAVVVDMTSGVPTETRTIAAALAKRGVAMIDAPVSGGVKGAEAGTLAIMVGGDAAIADRLEPMLKAMGSRVFHCGPLGAGQAMKALNNYVSAAGLVAAGEAIVVAKRFGLDPERLVDVLNASSGRNNTTENKLRQFVLSGSYDDGFALRLMLKDIGIALGLAQETGTERGIAAATIAVWERAAAALPPDVSHTELIGWLGFDRRGETGG